MKGSFLRSSVTPACSTRAAVGPEPKENDPGSRTQHHLDYSPCLGSRTGPKQAQLCKRGGEALVPSPWTALQRGESRYLTLELWHTDVTASIPSSWDIIHVKQQIKSGRPGLALAPTWHSYLVELTGRYLPPPGLHHCPCSGTP